MAEGELVGKVTHFYDRISVAVVSLSQSLKIGDRVHFLGRGSDFDQEITSMQVEHEDVSEVKAGGEVAVKVQQRVRPGDSLYRLTGED